MASLRDGVWAKLMSAAPALVERGKKLWSSIAARADRTPATRLDRSSPPGSLVSGPTSPTNQQMGQPCKFRYAGMYLSG